MILEEVKHKAVHDAVNAHRFAMFGDSEVLQSHIAQHATRYFIRLKNPDQSQSCRFLDGRLSGGWHY